MDLTERITCDPTVMEGQPCIRGLRIPVAMIFDSLADGMTEQEIRRELPALERDDFRAAYAYASARAREEIVPLAP